MGAHEPRTPILARLNLLNPAAMDLSLGSSALPTGVRNVRPTVLAGVRGDSSAAGEVPIPVRVMHVVSRLQTGGMELGVVKLVNGLDPDRVQSAICSTRPADSVKHSVLPRVPVFELNRRDGNDPRLVWQLYRLFRRERPHIVHTHAWGTLFEGMIAARLARVPLVVHGEHGTLQLKRYQRWLQRHGWSRADRLLSVSTRLAERMAREVGYPAARITTIRNGVDLSRFGRIGRRQARMRLGLPADGLLCGAVGRLVAVKDHLTLLNAMGILRGSGVEATVVLAGDGPLKDMLMAHASALGIADSVRLLRHCPEVETVFAALDVFVLCSVSEGLSNTILEAMASGLPVVATHVGGADELVKEGVTGRLVPARSPGALARGLLQLFRDDGVRASMGAAGRKRAESEFALLEMVRRYESLYLDAASGSLQPGRFDLCLEGETRERVEA
jgi:sugar transferase (PEP-CTERM/EpsH1 system associated)